MCVFGGATNVRAEEDATTDAGAAKIPDFAPGAEKFEFQAEVSRLMDIIINSLYSNKDIFLRELISNGSDSLDKIRFMSLTDKEQLGSGENADLDIRIKADKERKVLTIRDRGIGMTKDDLMNNLGTIAKSGTSAFLDQMASGGDMSLIGQFGVGFYSVYLVADFVEVRSKHNDDDKQWVWQSKADGNFAISEDEGEPLGRGVEINIYLKEEAQEYLEETKLQALVERYSEFINFPIYLYNSKEVSEEVPVEAGDEDEEADVSGDDAEDDEEGDDEEGDEDEEDDEPKTKTVTKTVWDWERLNDVKAIWLRSTNEVEEEEYTKFYQALAKNSEEPLAYSHFKAEGDVEFKAILYIPERPSPDYYDNYYSRASALKLYVRRVFISDEFDELLPKYLSFIKGIVDSDTLPLNVSRETLQQHTSLKTIKKKLVRKALDMIRKLAEEGGDAEDDDAKPEGEDDAATKDEPKYEKFWKSFGKAIKLGIIEDASNRVRLAKLLRFQTSKSDGKLVSLEQYVERMKEGQKSIYYITGESIDALKNSPFLEKLISKDFEVIYFTDPIDEYTMQNLTEFDDFKFSNASKEDLKFGDADDDEKARFKKTKEAFKSFTTWWKSKLPDTMIEAVKVSNRLSTTPCVVVSSKYGWSANMERIMKAQAMGDESRHEYMRGKKTLEVNPRHPMIAALKERAATDPDSEETETLAKLMFETAMLESGFSFDKPQEYTSRVFDLLKSNMGIEKDAELVDETQFHLPEEEDEEDKKEETKEETKEAPKDEL
uniref:Histidine kinase/HSP90-like ATPase domain-containing protein n=1 Tax=Ostreococcus sp. 'lucimarinus' TaxID=242159 RepID=A0A7R9T4N2_9CHLO